MMLQLFHPGADEHTGEEPQALVAELERHMLVRGFL